MSSNIILCDSYCPVCGSRMTLDRSCSGDYYETDTNIILLKTCSNKACGIQDPPIKGFDPMYLSKRKQRFIKTKIAERYGLGFMSVKKKTKNVKTNDKKVFAKEISKLFNIPLIESMNLIN